jgi:Cu/Zn superoxide dismutase
VLDTDGRAIDIHAFPDDVITQPRGGGCGGRVACRLIVPD